MKLFRGNFINWRAEPDFNRHDVFQGAERTIIPKLLVFGLLLETVFESDSALLAVLELLVDAHSKINPNQLQSLQVKLTWGGEFQYHHPPSIWLSLGC